MMRNISAMPSFEVASVALRAAVDGPTSTTAACFAWSVVLAAVSFWAAAWRALSTADWSVWLTGPAMFWPAAAVPVSRAAPKAAPLWAMFADAVCM